MEQIQKISTKAVIREEEQLLMVQDTKGMWELPGGRVEFGERPQETLAREVREELGVEARVGKLLGIDSFVVEKEGASMQIILLFFECSIEKGELALDHESLAYAWIKKGEVENYPMRDVYREFLAALI